MTGRISDDALAVITKNPALNTDFASSVGRRSRASVAAAFEIIGGVEEFALWAETNKTDFYTKIFTKTITREIDVTDERSVEGLLAQLDAGVLSSHILDEDMEDADFVMVETTTPAPIKSPDTYHEGVYAEDDGYGC